MIDIEDTETFTKKIDKLMNEYESEHGLNIKEIYLGHLEMDALQSDIQPTYYNEREYVIRYKGRRVFEILIDSHIGFSAWNY